MIFSLYRQISHLLAPFLWFSVSIRQKSLIWPFTNPKDGLKWNLRLIPSDSISGIQGYKYWATNYRRFVLKEFYSFHRNFNVQICKRSTTKLNHSCILLFTFFNLCLHFSFQYLYTHFYHRWAAEIKVLRIFDSSLSPWYTVTAHTLDSWSK